MEAVRVGDLRPDEAVSRLKALPFADLGFARVDHHRSMRQGLPEAVYGPGKSPEQCAAIVIELLDGGDGPVVLTRSDERQRAAVESAAPGGQVTPGPDGTATVTWRPAADRGCRVLVASAGTSDLPVAAECAAVLAAHGAKPAELVDVGVAGLHRLLVEVEQLQAADAIVVVAGMEGALASVVGGLTAVPVVAVPTSTGYGAGLEGVTALLGMLASCASGVTVVGIDNGFGAACAVLRSLPLQLPRPPLPPLRTGDLRQLDRLNPVTRISGEDADDG
jgi:NCAIR mutase (PurE)-related protein